MFAATQPARKAPFPYFGGKSKIAPTLWSYLGDTPNYVEPFAGSLATLLVRPQIGKVETVNDLDGLLVNFWRAVAADPAAVAAYADYPVIEYDLFARHLWLVAQKDGLATRLMRDPEYYNAKIAGWWVWGACAWIGGGWCSGDGPWTVQDGEIVKRNAGQGINRQLPHLGDAGRGINRQLPHLGNAGQGINRKLPHLGDAGQGINRKLPHLSAGRGINRQLPHLSAGQGINRKLPHLNAGRGAWIASYFADLQARLRDVRIACGDWRRVLTPSVTTRHGLTAVLLDPPYGEGAMDYSAGGNATSVAADVWAWALANGDDPLLRIAVCGYDDGRSLPDGWTARPWKAAGGYGKTDAAKKNSGRETIWLSRHCLEV